MGAATSSLTIEVHGFLAERLADLGRRRGTRTIIDTNTPCAGTVAEVLENLVRGEPRFGVLYDAEHTRLPEHVEVILNDRVLDLQGGLDAQLKPGDVLGFLPAHAGGA
jgi:molybdopterin converting factor small subunit